MQHLSTFKLKFNYLRSDVCPKCCSLSAKIADPATTPEEKVAAKAILLDHSRDAKMSYEYRSDQAKLSKTNPALRYRVVTFDFAANPKVPDGDAGGYFYSRTIQGSVYPCCCMTTGKSVVYIYTEREGGKGSNEVGSIVIKYFMDVVKNKR